MIIIMKCKKCGKLFEKTGFYYVAPPYDSVCKPCYDSTPFPWEKEKIEDSRF